MRAPYLMGRRGKKTIRTHRLIAERALGKPLPSVAQVHHADGDKLNNKGKLVICEDAAYHKLLHQRERALVACGNPNWRKCHICKQWDDPEVLTVIKGGINSTRAYHRSCAAKQRRLNRAAA